MLIVDGSNPDRISPDRVGCANEEVMADEAVTKTLAIARVSAANAAFLPLVYFIFFCGRLGLKIES